MKKTAVLILLIPVLLFSIIFVRIYTGIMPVSTVRSNRTAVEATGPGTKDQLSAGSETKSSTGTSRPETLTNKMMEDSLINEISTPPLKFYSAEN